MSKRPPAPPLAQRLPLTLAFSPVPQIAAVDEDGREDKATIKCETSPPPTPRTVRMTHTLPASSHNDARG